VTAGELDELGRVVDVLVEAMDNGWFPANPGQARTHRERQCESCPYDTVCPVDRDRSWGAMQEDPRLARYAALVTPS